MSTATKAKKLTVKEQLAQCKYDEDQLLSMIERYMSGGLKIDLRHYNRATRRWAEHWGLIVKNEETGAYSWGPSWKFNIAYDTPLEVLWRLFEKHVMPEENCGYSLAKRKGWRELNIAPVGDSLHSERERNEMEHVLIRFTQHNKLYFQACADVWDVRKRKDRER